jgi:hypothetical protein
VSPSEAVMPLITTSAGTASIARCAEETEDSRRIAASGTTRIATCRSESAARRSDFKIRIFTGAVGWRPPTCRGAAAGAMAATTGIPVAGAVGRSGLAEAPGGKANDQGGQTPGEYHGPQEQPGDRRLCGTAFSFLLAAGVCGDGGLYWTRTSDLFHVKEAL